MNDPLWQLLGLLLRTALYIWLCIWIYRVERKVLAMAKTREQVRYDYLTSVALRDTADLRDDMVEQEEVVP